MKQHHQRILRLWRCPECDRTVRLPGRVTSRTCRCRGEATLMQLQETERIRKFDIDSFVSYQTDEDVTPTAAELVEEIPKHLMPVGPTEEEIAAKAAKPRRGKAYLRTEIDEDSTATKPAAESESEVDDFGAGIENELPATNAAESDADAQSKSQSIEAEPGTANNESDSTSEGNGRKRKRRRKRRSRTGGRREGDAGSEPKSEEGSTDSPSAVVSDTSSERSGQSSDSDQDSTATGNAPGKKRRRRRRRRGKGGTPNSDGVGSANNSTESAPSQSTTPSD